MENAIDIRNATENNVITSQIPPGTKSLLGLGLKYCIEQPRPYQNLCLSLKQLKRSINLRNHLLNENINNMENDNNNYNPRLYVPLKDWNPNPCGYPQAEAFLRFQKIITNMRQNLPTYRRFNLKPFQRRPLSQLKRNNSILIYPSDKNLGPYVIDCHTYIKQCLEEHLLKTKNYEQLTTTKAIEGLQKQKEEFLQHYNKNKHIK